MSRAYIWQRFIDLEGKLRIPDFLYDDYRTCYISLGLFSRHYLQLTPDGVVHLIESDITGSFTDREAFRLQRNFHTGTKLRQDHTGRIQVPVSLLNKVDIPLGSEVIGEAGPRNPQWKGGEEPAYWTLEAKHKWLERNSAGAYSLDLLT